ncbi:hypothetical protein [Spiroplasma endosymbiont of Stenodema calcarata]|uniref:hypothetical protein n=1 Tax=Spiroplasma endosymbiont of Stenodema calcarata TaxID=3139328 RepID=UPI003CCAB1EC
MTLNGVIKNSEKVVFETNVTLLENDLDKKLTNFGNLIIAFLKFYNVSFEKHYIFEVNQTAFDEIVSEGMNNYSVPKTLFKIFKNSDIAKKMPDIDLFEFICSTLGWGEKKFVYNGDNYLVYHAGGIDGTFLFGNIDTNFKQSSLWYMPFYWFSDNKYEIKKI